MTRGGISTRLSTGRWKHSPYGKAFLRDRGWRHAGILPRMDLLSSMPPMTVATYLTLLCSIVALWFGRNIWIGVLAVAIVAGYASGVLYGLAVLWIALFGALCFGYSRATQLANGWARRVSVGFAALGVLVLALLLGMHVLPGFRNFLALDDVVLSSGAEPYTLYLNFDKTVVGIFILGICSAPCSVRARIGLAHFVAPCLSSRSTR